MMKAIENRYIEAATALAGGHLHQLHRIADSCDALRQTLDAIRMSNYHSPKTWESYKHLRATGWEPEDFAEIAQCKAVVKDYIQQLQTRS